MHEQDPIFYYTRPNVDKLEGKRLPGRHSLAQQAPAANLRIEALMAMTRGEKRLKILLFLPILFFVQFPISRT